MNWGCFVSLIICHVEHGNTMIYISSEQALRCSYCVARVTMVHSKKKRLMLERHMRLSSTKDASSAKAKILHLTTP
jgi:hypothetical protein